MAPGEHVTVADVAMPEGLTCLTEPDRMILSVAHPKVRTEETAEAEETAEEAAAAPAEGGEAAEAEKAE